MPTDWRARSSGLVALSTFENDRAGVLYQLGGDKFVSTSVSRTSSIWAARLASPVGTARAATIGVRCGDDKFVTEAALVYLMAEIDGIITGRLGVRRLP